MLLRCAFGMAGLRALVFLKHLVSTADSRWQVHLLLGLSLHIMQCSDDPGTPLTIHLFQILTSNVQRVKRDPTPTQQTLLSTKTMDRWNAILASDHSLTNTLHSQHKDLGFGDGRLPYERLQPPTWTFLWLWMVVFVVWRITKGVTSRTTNYFLVVFLWLASKKTAAAVTTSHFLFSANFWK